MACGLVSAAKYTPAGEQAQIAWPAQLQCGHLGFLITTKGLAWSSSRHIGNLPPSSLSGMREDDKAVCTMTCRVDDDWHHVAVTWEGHTGAASLHFDGKEITPFWRASGGRVDQQYPAQGGVDKHLAAGTARFDHGKHPGLPKDALKGFHAMSDCLVSEAGLHSHGKAISYRGRPGRCYRLIAAGAIRSAASDLSMPRVLSVAMLKTECPLLQARWCWDKTRSALAHASRPRSPWTAPWLPCASGTASAPRQAPLASQALNTSFITKKIPHHEEDHRDDSL